MALVKKLIKIENYTGLYFQDENNIFKDLKKISISNIHKKIQPPFVICSRLYEGKKSIYATHHITNSAKTIKRICDEISANRKIKQLEKNFKPKEVSKTLNQIFDEWIEYKKDSISYKHYQVTIYAYNANIKNILGNLQEKDITTKKIQQIVNTAIRIGKAPRTAKTIKDILSPVFAFGIKNGYCEDNPAKDVVIPKFDNQRYFTIETEDANKLYNIIVNYPILPIKGIFIFLLHGRRKSEALNLKWENINIPQKIYGLRDFENKSRSNKTFPLSNLQIQVLTEIGIKKRGYIFLKENGKPYKSIRCHWEKMKITLGLKIHLHDLRHLIGYFAVKQGVSLKAISETLGHSNTQVTERYSNVAIDMVEDTLNKVFDAIDNKKTDNVVSNDKLEKLKILFPDKTEEQLNEVINLFK
jgi:integrase